MSAVLGAALAWLAAPSPSPTPGAGTVGGAPVLMYVVGGLLFLALVAALVVGMLRADPGQGGTRGGANWWN